MQKVRPRFLVGLGLAVGLLAFLIEAGIGVAFLNLHQAQRNDRAAHALATTDWPKAFTSLDGCFPTKERLCLRTTEPSAQAVHELTALLGITDPLTRAASGIQGRDVTVTGTYHGVPIRVTAATRIEYPHGWRGVRVSWVFVYLDLSTILKPEPLN